MQKHRFVSAFIALATLCSAPALLEPSTRAADPKSAATADGISAVYTAKETTKFKELAKETLAALAAGKNNKMVAKLTDLETIWDEKEATLKPKNEATWTSIDKTLDKGISALRSSKVNLKKGKAALEDLLKKLDEATKH